MLTWDSKHFFKKDVDLGEQTGGKNSLIQTQNEAMQIPTWMPQLSNDKPAAIRCLKNVNLLTLAWLFVQ